MTIPKKGLHRIADAHELIEILDQDPSIQTVAPVYAVHSGSGTKFLKTSPIDVIVTEQYGKTRRDERMAEMYTGDACTTDGSSVGMQDVTKSGLRLLAQNDQPYYVLDDLDKDGKPTGTKTLHLIGFTQNLDRSENDQDPRLVAQRAARHFETEIGTLLRVKGAKMQVGTELEFSVFPIGPNGQPVYPEDVVNEGHYNGTDDQCPILSDYCKEVVRLAKTLGIPTDGYHLEVAGYQGELKIVYEDMVSKADTDSVLFAVMEHVAKKQGVHVAFETQPLKVTGQKVNGAGRHLNFSISHLVGDVTKNLLASDLFAKDGMTGLNEVHKWMMAGVIDHAHALQAWINRHEGSASRLSAGLEAPTREKFGRDDREAILRVPSVGEDGLRSELRPNDPQSNPYLAYSAVMMAALDGIRRGVAKDSRIEEIIQHSIASATDKHLRAGRLLSDPETGLNDALAALEKDHEFLTKDGVFSEHLVGKYIEETRKEGEKDREKFETRRAKYRAEHEEQGQPRTVVENVTALALQVSELKVENARLITEVALTNETLEAAQQARRVLEGKLAALEGTVSQLLEQKQTAHV